LEASCLGAAAIVEGISPLRFAPVEMTDFTLTFKTLEKPLQRK